MLGSISNEMAERKIGNAKAVTSATKGAEEFDLDIELKEGSYGKRIGLNIGLDPTTSFFLIPPVQFV